MAGTTFKWNTKAFEAIRRSPEAVKLLEGIVESVANEAGPGYSGSVIQGKPRGTLGRAIGSVQARTKKAQRDNAKNHTLMRVFPKLGRR